MTRFLQSIVLLLSQTPFNRLLKRVYDLGVRRAIAALSNHSAVACIFGTGSYFENRATYGLSDVDLIIVLRDQITRGHGAIGELAYAYERIRRSFPFLGRWPEKEANLIFLSDIAAGFPAPESFRIRFKQGRLVPLFGELPSDFCTGPITTSEVIVEIDTLLRFSLVSNPLHATRLIFWKRIFDKLNKLTRLIGLEVIAQETRNHADLSFLAEPDTALFFRKGDPARLFSLLLSFSRRVFDAIAASEPMVKISYTVGSKEISKAIEGTPIPFSNALDQADTIDSIPSIPLGLAPRMFYFSIDDRVPVLNINRAAYDGLQRVRQAQNAQGHADENALVSVDGFLFIATRQPHFVDLIPLDPVLFANVYAVALSKGENLNNRIDFEMPASIVAEQKVIAKSVFHALAHLYRTNDGVMTKLPHPCVYRENDGEVVENALRLLRAHAASDPRRLLFLCARDLFDYLCQQHKDCEPFLVALERYYRFLHGDMSRSETIGNNLYRCLHQFMAQALDDFDDITVDSPSKHLSITVGVITRNRAKDLAELLDSLTRQLRAPDEVVVVDNGSNDSTQNVIDSFRDRLPLRCQFLSQANIPAARNLVIDSATSEIVSFIDDDCISEPQWLAAVERGFLRAENIGIVGGWVLHEPAPQRSTVDIYYRVFHHRKS